MIVPTLARISAHVALIAALLLASNRPVAAVVAGDANRDGRLSAPDVTVMQRILGGTDPGVIEADANNDGFILADDLEMTVRQIFASASSRTPTPSSAPSFTATPRPSPTATRPAVPSATTTRSSIPTPTRSATHSATAPQNPISTPTRTATPTPTASPSVMATVTPRASPTRTVGAVMRTYCDAIDVGLAIPDQNLAGLVRTIVIDDGARIDDLNVQVDVPHTWVGDLQITLTHVDTGTTVILLDRPGMPASSDGCGGVDVLATFDADAGRIAENVCEEPIPAIFGSLRPSGDLRAFEGESIGGTWRLEVADLAAQDTGELFGWCLQVNSLGPVPTAFTCGGAQSCTVDLAQEFTLNFSVTDPDGNAAAWEMIQIRDDGNVIDAAAGVFSPTVGVADVSVVFDPFFCVGPGCSTTAFDYQLVITDADGLRSPPLRVRLIVFVPGGP